MELQAAAVSHHQDELHDLAGELRWERRSDGSPSGRAGLRRFRNAVGRRFLAIGVALIDPAPGIGVARQAR
jgi:hypothetical protein